MNKYKVYFKFNGKKQAMIVDAKSKNEAKYYVEDKLCIDKVQILSGVEPEPKIENVDFLKDMFGIK